MTLELPAPARKVETVSQSGSASLPTGAWSGGSVPTQRAEGQVTRTAWRLPGQTRTVQQILAPARDALREAGYEIGFDCADAECGGFDFRFALDLLPPPSMYVDLGNYRYVLARGVDGAVVSLVASRAASAGYLHVTEVLPEGTMPSQAVTIAAPSAASGPVWDSLRRNGRAVLDDLVFATGSSALAGGPFGSLGALAEGLRSDPGTKITLVGHSDTEGGLEPNIAISRARARAVRKTLIGEYDIAPDRIAAEGVAYLAPRASNLTAEGREANRRVEVVLTPD